MKGATEPPGRNGGHLPPDSPHNQSKRKNENDEDNSSSISSNSSDREGKGDELEKRRNVAKRRRESSDSSSLESATDSEDEQHQRSKRRRGNSNSSGDRDGRRNENRSDGSDEHNHEHSNVQDEYDYDSDGIISLYAGSDSDDDAEEDALLLEERFYTQQTGQDGLAMETITTAPEIAPHSATNPRPLFGPNMTVGESMQSIEDQYHLDAFMGQDLYNTTSTAEFDAFHEDVMERMDARYKTPFFRRLLKEENWELIKKKLLRGVTSRFRDWLVTRDPSDDLRELLRAAPWTPSPNQYSFGVYFKVGLSKDPAHQDLGYCGSGGSLPQSLYGNVTEGALKHTGVRRRRGQHERNFEEAIELGPSRHYQEIFNRLVAKHPELYELLFGLGFEYIIEDFFNNLEVADMRVMILLVEAWLAEALGLYSNSEESWKGTCSHSALIEGVRGVSNSFRLTPEEQQELSTIRAARGRLEYEKRKADPEAYLAYLERLAAWSRDAALKKKTENPEKWEEHLDKEKARYEGAKEGRKERLLQNRIENTEDHIERMNRVHLFNTMKKVLEPKVHKEWLIEEKTMRRLTRSGHAEEQVQAIKAARPVLADLVQKQVVSRAEQRLHDPAATVAAQATRDARALKEKEARIRKAAEATSAPPRNVNFNSRPIHSEEERIDIYQLLRARGNTLRLPTSGQGGQVFRALSVLVDGNCAAGAILHLLHRPSATEYAQGFRLDVTRAARSERIGERMRIEYAGAGMGWTESDGRREEVTWDGILARLEAVEINGHQRSADLEIFQLELIAEHEQVHIRIWTHTGNGTFYDSISSEGVPADAPTINLLFDPEAQHYWALEPISHNETADLPANLNPMTNAPSRACERDPAVEKIKFQVKGAKLSSAAALPLGYINGNRTSHVPKYAAPSKAARAPMLAEWPDLLEAIQDAYEVPMEDRLHARKKPALKPKQAQTWPQGSLNFPVPRRAKPLRDAVTTINEQLKHKWPVWHEKMSAEEWIKVKETILGDESIMKKIYAEWKRLTGASDAFPVFLKYAKRWLNDPVHLEKAKARGYQKKRELQEWQLAVIEFFWIIHGDMAGAGLILNELFGFAPADGQTTNQLLSLPHLVSHTSTYNQQGAITNTMAKKRAEYNTRRARNVGERTDETENAHENGDDDEEDNGVDNGDGKEDDEEDEKEDGKKNASGSKAERKRKSGGG